MSTCARCDKPILEGQPRVVRDFEAASGPGRTIHLHTWCQRIEAAQPLRYPRGRGAC